MVAKDKGPRISALGKVLNVKANSGTADGEADTSCKKLSGAKSYVVQKSPDPITPASWTYAASPTKTKATITGLTSLSRWWFCWQGVGAAGNGEWSDPAMCVIP